MCVMFRYFSSFDSEVMEIGVSTLYLFIFLICEDIITIVVIGIVVEFVHTYVLYITYTILTF